VDPLKLRDALGHRDLATTMKYRHMKPTHERPSLERLSRTLPIEKVVTVARRRATRRKQGAAAVGPSTGRAKTEAKEASVNRQNRNTSEAPAITMIARYTLIESVQRDTPQELVGAI
jgi:hypothetical protein